MNNSIKLKLDEVAKLIDQRSKLEFELTYGISKHRTYRSLDYDTELTRDLIKKYLKILGTFIAKTSEVLSSSNYPLLTLSDLSRGLNEWNKLCQHIKSGVLYFSDDNEFMVFDDITKLDINKNLTEILSDLNNEYKSLIKTDLEVIEDKISDILSSDTVEVIKHDNIYQDIAERYGGSYIPNGVIFSRLPITLVINDIGDDYMEVIVRDKLTEVKSQLPIYLIYEGFVNFLKKLHLITSVKSLKSMLSTCASSEFEFKLLNNIK